MKKDNFELTWPWYWRALRVNYDATLAELLAGYDEAPAELSGENFPSSETGEREIQIGLVRFEVFPSNTFFPPSNHVWRYPPGEEQYDWLYSGNAGLAKRKLRHANPKELVTLGLLPTKLTAYRSIVALGQSWFGRQGLSASYVSEPYVWVPMIRCEGEKRRVMLTWKPGFDHETHSVETYIAVVRL